jgi:hypothetical protein
VDAQGVLGTVTRHIESAANAKRLLTEALVIITEMPDDPLLTHAADHVFRAAEQLNHWERRASRLVDTEPPPGDSK